MSLFTGVGPAISYNGPPKVVAPVDPNCEAQGLVSYSETKIAHGLRGIEKKTVVRCVTGDEAARLDAAKLARGSPLSTPMASPRASPVASPQGSPISSPALNGSTMSIKNRMKMFQKGGLDMTAWQASLAANRRANTMRRPSNARAANVRYNAPAQVSQNSGPVSVRNRIRAIQQKISGGKSKKNRKNKTKKNKNKSKK
jgi:hypothetical protein